MKPVPFLCLSAGRYDASPIAVPPGCVLRDFQPILFEDYGMLILFLQYVMILEKDQKKLTAALTERPLPENGMKAVEKVLELPEGLRAFAIFPYGYPAEEREQQDRFDESRIHYV